MPVVLAWCFAKVHENLLFQINHSDTIDYYIKDHLDVLNPEDILQKFSAQERLTELSSQDILKNIPLEKLEKHLAIIKKYNEKYNK